MKEPCEGMDPKEKTAAAEDKRQEPGSEASDEIPVHDRRHWAADNDEDGDGEASTEASPRKPTLIDEYRNRAEAAESRLQEYIEAFKAREREQDQVRARLKRDVDRRVEHKFGDLLGDLVATIDDLDLSLAHVRSVPEAEPLVAGLVMVRDGFLACLTRNGVERIHPVPQPALDVTHVLQLGLELRTHPP